MNACKSVPLDAVQHKTAGPYSPVLSIEGKRIVVISGQAALDLDGKIVGANIEEQTTKVLENCAIQLSYADCSLADVFKVNVFLTDLALWERFNSVYIQLMPDPKPVRTAVEVGLLPGMLVEIEMWAVL